MKINEKYEYINLESFKGQWHLNVSLNNNDSAFYRTTIAHRFPDIVGTYCNWETKQEFKFISVERCYSESLEVNVSPKIFLVFLISVFIA